MQAWRQTAGAQRWKWWNRTDAAPFDPSRINFYAKKKQPIGNLKHSSGASVISLCPSQITPSFVYLSLRIRIYIIYQHTKLNSTSAITYCPWRMYATWHTARQVGRSGSDVTAGVVHRRFRSAQRLPLPAAAWPRDSLLWTRQERDISQRSARQARIFHATGARRWHRRVWSTFILAQFISGM